MTKRALVCGAGISGLTAGIYLTRLGWDVTVFEKDPELRTAGAGLNLWPNGMRVLEKIGLRSPLSTIAASLDYYRTFSSTGDVIAVEDVRDWREKYGAPLCGVYRRDLSRILVEALGSEKLRVGHQLVSVEQGDDVVCTFANGEQVRGDFVMGADGIGSIVRSSVFGEREFSTDALVRWRGLFNLADVDVDPLSEAEVWGPDGHLGYLPIGGGRAYWFAAAEGITRDPEAIIEHFSGWRGSPVPGLIAATDKSTIIRSDLHDFVHPLDNWSKGRITLAGDAAHPMLPGMAQGANQALEDVDALCTSLDAHDDIADALKAYERTRIPQVAPIVRGSRSLFDFDDQNELVHGDKNPLFDRYERFVERRSTLDETSAA
ncbi:FAD-dependent oxidoreductase [Aquamicrobium ahrensii]|uniref:2-polyprenyl-6-methoxyphenol hydroxylase-like FAD-dependent oxidoreductase n=1 Tax=Aquamicrobium ahrensii TaxID=469551 RepID=A0ABV2KMX7_9HYPH